MAEWTVGRLKTFVTSTLRGGFRRYPPKFETLKEACTGKKINEKTGRLAAHYKCAECLGEFPAKDVNVDHKNPVVDHRGFTTWDDFIARLFCEKSNLQVLCEQCHNKKSLKEKQERKLNANN